MQESLQEKLEKLSARQEEIYALLTIPEVINDQNRYRDLNKEAAEIGPIVNCFKSYQSNRESLDNARAMLKDSDQEIRDLAAEEMEVSRQRLDALETELQKLLLPKDPADNSNIFLEIRAGTGGEEAALFSADLMRMYSPLRREFQLANRIVEHHGKRPGRIQGDHDAHYRYRGLFAAEIRIRRAPGAKSAGDGVPGTHSHLGLYRCGAARSGRDK